MEKKGYEDIYQNIFPFWDELSAEDKEYICLNSGALITIGFEKQQIISHRGVIKGIDANIGNPLYGFKDWEIILE